MAPAEPHTSARSPLELITRSDVAFVIDYANSEPRRAAEKACDEEADDDLARRGACLQKARDQFAPDVLRFQREGKSSYRWQVYKRTGSALKEVFVGPVDLVEESPTAVRLKLAGNGRGQRPLFRSAGELRIALPDDSSLELEDPDLGRLLYTAKIGLVAR